MTRENDGTEREAQGVGRDMSCPRHVFQTSDGGWPACGRQTSGMKKTSARLKITFDDMTYPMCWAESTPLCPPFSLDNEFNNLR